MFDLFIPHAIMFKHFTVPAFGNILEMVSGTTTEHHLRASRCRGLAGRYLFLRGILRGQLSSALCRRAELHKQPAHNTPGHPRTTSNPCKPSPLQILVHTVCTATSAVHLLCSLFQGFMHSNPKPPGAYIPSVSPSSEEIRIVPFPSSICTSGATIANFSFSI